MAESHSRIRLAFLVAVLIGVATVSMVVDRRALRDGTRDLPAWAGPILDATIPVQRAVAFPAEVVRGAWGRYVALVGVNEENASGGAASFAGGASAPASGPSPGP